MRPQLVIAEHSITRARLYGQMLMLPEPPLTLVAVRIPKRRPWPPGSCLCGVTVLVPLDVLGQLANRRLHAGWPELAAAVDDAERTCGLPPDVRALPPLEVPDDVIAGMVAVNERRKGTK